MVSCGLFHRSQDVHSEAIEPDARPAASSAHSRTTRTGDGSSIIDASSKALAESPPEYSCDDEARRSGLLDGQSSSAIQGSSSMPNGPWRSRAPLAFDGSSSCKLVKAGSSHHSPTVEDQTTSPWWDDESRTQIATIVSMQRCLDAASQQVARYTGESHYGLMLLNKNAETSKMSLRNAVDKLVPTLRGARAEGCTWGTMDRIMTEEGTDVGVQGTVRSAWDRAKPRAPPPRSSVPPDVITVIRGNREYTITLVEGA